MTSTFLSLGDNLSRSVILPNNGQEMIDAFASLITTIIYISLIITCVFLGRDFDAWWSGRSGRGNSGGYLAIEAHPVVPGWSISRAGGSNPKRGWVRVFRV